MSTILSQKPIELHNPYSVLLESEHEPSLASTADNVTYSHITNSRAILTRALSDDDLDRVSVSSWSVVNSTYASDNEDDDDDDEAKEIYIDASAYGLAPLTVAALSDGFTNISNIMTATSINSSSVTAQPNTWVIKVSKSRQDPSLRKRKASTATAPSLEDVVERSESDSQEEEDDEEDRRGDLFMSMSEHELSKSAKAVKLKNVRLATAYDVALCKALNVTNKKANGGPKLPKTKGRSEKTKTRSTDLD
ncbi:hypothetical protein BGZ65_006893 [Modicella reniformis]|uniref:Uncharacterized protein n=1 Tax=Modicella reniformis TaxID=1440133 RepID=A0A9P6MB52_9FUNG|nr:hypothetical protein BGZ65_006893 [Modicella reniformis]